MGKSVPAVQALVLLGFCLASQAFWLCFFWINSLLIKADAWALGWSRRSLERCCRCPPPKKTQQIPKEEEYLYSLVVNSGCLSPFPRVPGSTSNLPQKTLRMMGGLPWVCYSRGRNGFSCGDVLSLGCKTQALSTFITQEICSSQMHLVLRTPVSISGCFPGSPPAAWSLWFIQSLPLRWSRSLRSLLVLFTKIRINLLDVFLL